MSAVEKQPMPAAELLELSIAVPDHEVRRYLGYPRGRASSPSVAVRVTQLRPVAQRLLRPRGALRLLEAAALAPSGIPRPSQQLVIGLCTIGAELETESQRRGDAGEPLDALILDAFGSAAAEAAAEALAARGCALAAEQGLRAQRRFSPGYGRWPVSAQAALLALLPGEELGVSLTEGSMMLPRKSVSFAMRLQSRAVAARRAESPCRGCDRQRCAYRRNASSEGESS